VNALPLVIIALLALVAVGSSNTTVIIVIGTVFAPIIARTVRSAVLSERELDYVAAARLRGENALYIMFAEILPNVMAPILVEFTVRLGYAIFAVATLSFIGFGIQPPSPDWGLAIAEQYGLINGGYWWTVLFDALAIASLVVGVNLFADAIHGALET
jgi:peptide/nickel transport system permease protein